MSAFKKESPILYLMLLAGCISGKGDSGTDSTTDSATDSLTESATVPTVISTEPLRDAMNVPVNSSIQVTFSEEMLPDSMDSFTVSGPDGPVSATVIYAGLTAVLWPSVHLKDDSAFTATVSTDVKSLAGVALAEDYRWDFRTGTTVVPGLPVQLGTAGNFAILAKSGVSTVPPSKITGDVGISPAAASFLTGFSLTADATNVFATSPQVTGRLYAADYAPPTPSNLTGAVRDMELAYTDAAGRAPDVTELGAGNIGGMTLAPGVYKWGTGLLIPSDLTLIGTPADVWIFQVGQDLTVSSGTRIVLAGGAVPENVFWQVAGSVNLGTTTHAEGIILAQTAITLLTGASVNGRLLAQTAVDIDSSEVVVP